MLYHEVSALPTVGCSAACRFPPWHHRRLRFWVLLLLLFFLKISASEFWRMQYCLDSFQIQIRLLIWTVRLALTHRQFGQVRGSGTSSGETGAYKIGQVPYVLASRRTSNVGDSCSCQLKIWQVRVTSNFLVVCLWLASPHRQWRHFGWTAWLFSSGCVPLISEVCRFGRAVLAASPGTITAALDADSLRLCSPHQLVDLWFSGLC